MPRRRTAQLRCLLSRITPARQRHPCRLSRSSQAHTSVPPGAAQAHPAPTRHLQGQSAPTRLDYSADAHRAPSRRRSDCTRDRHPSRPTRLQRARAPAPARCRTILFASPKLPLRKPCSTATRPWRANTPTRSYPHDHRPILTRACHIDTDTPKRGLDQPIIFPQSTLGQS